MAHRIVVFVVAGSSLLSAATLLVARDAEA